MLALNLDFLFWYGYVLYAVSYDLFGEPGTNIRDIFQFYHPNDICNDDEADLSEKNDDLHWAKILHKTDIYIIKANRTD